MAKIQKKQTSSKYKKESGFRSFSLNKIIPEKYQDILLVILPLILLLIFFGSVIFGDKTFISGDIQASKSMENYLKHAREVGSFPLWTPYIFLGMPSYMVETSLRWFDLTLSILYYMQQFLVAITSSKVMAPIFYFYILAVTVYFFLRSKGVERLIAFFGGIGATFSTGMIVFIAIGHNTKMLTLCMIPVIIFIMEKYREKFSFKYIPLLIIAIHLQLLSAHIQEIFYAFFIVLIYFIFFFVRAIIIKKKDEILNLVKSGVFFILAAAIAGLMSIDQYWGIYEYNPYSIRGTQSIVKPETFTKKASGTGLDYDYATNWSFSPGEMLTFIIPSYYGYGNSTYQGELSNNQPVDVNTYWGQMPFVDVPQYLGILIFIFALFGIYYKWKEPIVKFLTILSLVSLLISFGRTFPILYDLMFYYFPMFDKFRVPSMILNILQIVFPILAAMGINEIVKSKEESRKINLNLINISLYIFGGLFLISIILRGGLEGWYVGLLTQSGKVQKELFEYAYQMFINDFTFTTLIATLGLLMLKFFVSDKISKDLLYISLILLLVIDLFVISSRGMKMFNKTDMEQTFSVPEYVNAIKKDNSVFRVINVKQRGLGSLAENSNYYSSFLLQDFYGYSAAKPRTYQDMIDVIGPVNNTLWRMYNVKYIITDQEINDSNFATIYKGGEDVVLENKLALPRAYFVNSYEIKPMLEVLNLIKTDQFDPRDKLFFEPGQDYNLPKIDPPTAEASINITKYLYENIEMEVNATGNNLMFFGDTYYPVGWNAYIDGNKVEVYRANHAGRALVVPVGKHKVEFKYEPQSFYLGKNISLVLNIIVLGLLLWVVITYFQKRKKVVTE